MGEKIIPRWEWRTFKDAFADEVKDRIKGSEKLVFKESEEVYILSKNSDENIKIRDELMDIKSLIEVNNDGLEQWKPIMKEGFPISTENIEKLFEILKVKTPDLLRDEYTYEQFLNEIIGANEKLKAVDVTKSRDIHKINECIVEIAGTTFDGNPLKTVCVEHEEPKNVINTVEELGLRGDENINYIKAMKKSVGF